MSVSLSVRHPVSDMVHRMPKNNLNIFFLICISSFYVSIFLWIDYIIDRGSLQYGDMGI